MTIYYSFTLTSFINLTLNLLEKIWKKNFCVVALIALIRLYCATVSYLPCFMFLTKYTNY